MWLYPVPIGIETELRGGACYRELPRIPIPRTSVNKNIKKAERPGLDARSPARFYYALTVLSQKALAVSAGRTATALTVGGAIKAKTFPATSSVLASQVRTALAGDE